MKRPRMTCTHCGADVPQRVDGTPCEHTMPPSPAGVQFGVRRYCDPRRVPYGAPYRGTHCPEGHATPCYACAERGCCEHCATKGDGRGSSCTTCGISASSHEEALAIGIVPAHAWTAHTATPTTAEEQA